MSLAIARICRYPVKGLSAEVLRSVLLSVDEGLPWDRRFAVAHGGSLFDPANPAWARRREFLQVAHDEKLVLLDARIDMTGRDGGAAVLTLRLDGRVVCTADLTSAEGWDAVGEFFDGFLAGDERGPPRLVSAPGVMFTDMPDKWVSILNRASLRDLAGHAGRAIDERRFRGNLLFDGGSAWQEFNWIGQVFRIGTARLRIVERIGRCAATTVDPATAERDLNIPKILSKAYGHSDCGVYAEIMAGGTVAEGDEIVPA
jgi:uncharacterized protein YcbX